MVQQYDRGNCTYGALAGTPAQKDSIINDRMQVPGE
jgi:hypothetical protein